MSLTTKLDKNGNTMYYIDGKRVTKDVANGKAVAKSTPKKKFVIKPPKSVRKEYPERILIREEVKTKRLWTVYSRTLYNDWHFYSYDHDVAEAVYESLIIMNFIDIVREYYKEALTDELKTVEDVVEDFKLRPKDYLRDLIYENLDNVSDERPCLSFEEYISPKPTRNMPTITDDCGSRADLIRQHFE